MQFMKILPEHIPCGDKFTSDDLATLNDRLRKQSLEMLILLFVSLVGMPRLVRKCPKCGAIQRKYPPRWWSIPLTVAMTFAALVVLCLILLFCGLGNFVSTNYLFDGMMMAILFASPIYGIVRYIIMRKKNAPEYEFVND